MESAASGLLAGRNAARVVQGLDAVVAPRTTAIGALAHYASHADPRHYQPSNITFGIMPALDDPPRDKAERKARLAERALTDLAAWTSMTDALKAFVEHLAYNRHLSAHSVRAYTSDVEQYLAGVAAARGRRVPALTAADLDGESVRAFVIALNKAAQARTSVARKVSGVRAFLRYLRREGWLDGDPAGAVVAPRLDRTIPLHLSEAEMRRLLDTPDPTTPLGRRDRAMLELFYASGLRLSELVGLDLEDVHLSGRMLRVLGKGGKERLLPFNRAAETALKEWLPDRERLRRLAGVVHDRSREATPPPGRSDRAWARRGRPAAAASRGPIASPCS